VGVYNSICVGVRGALHDEAVANAGAMDDVACVAAEMEHASPVMKDVAEVFVNVKKRI
jgi:hypothetical protein